MPAKDAGWGRGTRPVINVGWDDAQQYVAWLSTMTGKTYRLLSESEREYGARGGSATEYSWGAEIGKGNANCDGCGSQWDKRQTAPVGSFAANAFGLYDMHGNVWEWVSDYYSNDYEGAPTDGSVWVANKCGGGVIRGGPWYNPSVFLRSAERVGSATYDRTYVLGFRVARTLTP
jgi:formylglycine-generating enzyme required for sulfatase activity